MEEWRTFDAGRLRESGRRRPKVSLLRLLGVSLSVLSATLLYLAVDLRPHRFVEPLRGLEFRETSSTSELQAFRSEVVEDSVIPLLEFAGDLQIVQNERELRELRLGLREHLVTARRRRIPETYREPYSELMLGIQELYYSSLYLEASLSTGPAETRSSMLKESQTQRLDAQKRLHQVRARLNRS